MTYELLLLKKLSAINVKILFALDQKVYTVKHNLLKSAFADKINIKNKLMLLEMSKKFKRL